MNDEKVLDISWGTILKISIAVICFYILYLVRDILIFFIFALIISVLFNPAIDFLGKLKIPRVLSVIFVYLGTFGMISLLIYLIIPLFIAEIQYFSQILPQYFDKIAPPLRGLGVEAFEDLESFITLFGKTLEEMATNIFSALFTIFGGISATLFIIAMAIFLSSEERGVEKSLSLLFPKKYEAYILSLWSRCQARVSGWFLSRILGCLFVGLASYLTFLLFNVNHPFSLGLLTAVLNFVPIVGPIITAVIVFVIVSLEDMLRAIFILIVFTLIQQIENNIILPILSKKFIGLSPTLVLISLAIGGTLWGFLGAVLAVPLAGILSEFFKEFLQKKREETPLIL